MPYIILTYDRLNLSILIWDMPFPIYLIWFNSLPNMVTIQLRAIVINAGARCALRTLHKRDFRDYLDQTLNIGQIFRSLEK